MGDRERHVCEKFAEWVARRHGPAARLEDFDVPDIPNRTTADVDASFRVGTTRYVVEHTKLLKFPDQKREDVGFKRVLWPLEGHPIGASLILIASGTAKQYQGVKDIPACHRAILRWIETTANSLGTDERRTAQPPGVGFPVTLWRDSVSLRTTLTVGRWASDHKAQEPKRRLVIGKAFADKLPKLERVAVQCQARSALLLEGDDLAHLSGLPMAGSVAEELAAMTGWVPGILGAFVIGQVEINVEFGVIVVVGHALSLPAYGRTGGPSLSPPRRRRGRRRARARGGHPAPLTVV